jgi:hypothetical protein
MFNDRLSNEEARERIQQRMDEAETYGLQKRLGFGDYGVARWVFALVILIVAVFLLF